MASPLAWVFKLFDGVSGPARKMREGVTGFGSSLKSAWQDLAKFSHGLDHMTNLGGKALRFFSDWIGRGFRVVEMLGEIQTSQKRFDLRLGAGGGADLLSYLERVSKTTAFTRRQLEAVVAPLVEEGFTLPDIARLLPGALDKGALKGGSIAEQLAQAQETARVFASIRETGRITGSAFKEADIQKALMARTGIPLAEIKKRMKIGGAGFSQDVLLESVLASITQDTGGPLGSGAAPMAGTIDALVNRLKDAPHSLIEKMLGNPKTLAQTETILKDLLKVLDGIPAKVGPGTQAWQDTITTLEVLGWVAKAVVLPIVVLGEALGWVGAMVAIVWLDFVRMGESIGVSLAKAWLATTKWIGDTWEWLKSAASIFGDVASDLGTAIWQGLRDGILGGVGFVKEAITGLGKSAISSLEGLFRIRSPSLVFARIGEQTAAGFVAGLDGSAARVDAAIGGAFAVDPSRFGAGGEARGAVGGGIHWSGDLRIEVPAEHAGSAREIARFSRSEVDAFMHSLFDRLAVESAT